MHRWDIQHYWRGELLGLQRRHLFWHERKWLYWLCCWHLLRLWSIIMHHVQPRYLELEQRVFMHQLPCRHVLISSRGDQHISVYQLRYWLVLTGCGCHLHIMPGWHV